MKTNKRITQWLALLALAILNAQLSTAPAAVAFSITPSAVSNTYSGTITLQVTGLTNGETVVVQKFLDLNTNGIIDDGDWLVQQFTITDGHASVFYNGSTPVTNLNVPCDMNSTTGAITAVMNFQGGDFVQNMPGKFLFKLSSPVNHFTPITNAFTVTNFPFAQKITGNVVNSGTNVPDAVVLLFNSTTRGGPKWGVIANNSGSYTIALPPGAYMLAAVKSNYIANYGAAPVVTLTNTQTITTNLTVTNATSSISGSVVDATNSSTGLPGVLVPMESTNGLLAVGFTDTNGNFSVGVQSGQWSIMTDDHVFIVHGYLAWENSTNANAGTTGFTIALPKATALVYGSVKDNLGNPMIGIDVNADDNNNQYYADGYTDTNGNYFIGLLGGSYSWDVGISGDNALSNYVLPNRQGVTLTNGQAIQINFIVYPVWFPFVSQPISPSAGEFGFTLSGAVGTNYTILASTNVVVPLSNWFTVLITNLSVSPASIQDNQATNQYRFYRVKVGP